MHSLAPTIQFRFDDAEIFGQKIVDTPRYRRYRCLKRVVGEFQQSQKNNSYPELQIMKKLFPTVFAVFSALIVSTTSHAVVITNAATAVENNTGSSTNTPGWFDNTDYFVSYGAITAAQWQSPVGTAPGFRGAGMLQWNLTGIGIGDSIGAVNSATISIVPADGTVGSTFSIYRLQSAFAALDPWNSKPLLDTSTFVTYTASAYDTGADSVNVSSLLANNGGLQTFGVAVLSNGYAGFQFFSTSYGNTFPAFDNQNRFSADYSVVPEPSTYAIVLFAVGVLMIHRCRRMLAARIGG